MDAPLSEIASCRISGCKLADNAPKGGKLWVRGDRGQSGAGHTFSRWPSLLNRALRAFPISARLKPSLQVSAYSQRCFTPRTLPQSPLRSGKYVRPTSSETHTHQLRTLPPSKDSLQPTTGPSTLRDVCEKEPCIKMPICRPPTCPFTCASRCTAFTNI